MSGPMNAVQQGLYKLMPAERFAVCEKLLAEAPADGQGLCLVRADVLADLVLDAGTARKLHTLVTQAATAHDDAPSPERSMEQGEPLRMPAQAAIAELLEWFDATSSKPLPQVQVLMWIKHPNGEQSWESGWWDTDLGWLLCESGGNVDGQVLFYADPEGPWTANELPRRQLYRVVVADAHGEMVRSVQLALDDGWDLHGGAIVTRGTGVAGSGASFTWAQALVRWE